jgi:integrase
MRNNNNVIYQLFRKINEDKLNDTTLNKYTTLISNLYKHFNSDINDFEPYFFVSEVYEVLKYLLNEVNNKYTRKTIISSILNLLRFYNDNEDKKLENVKNIYSKVMYSDNDEINKEKENNNKNKKEKENWINYDDIINIFKNMYKKYYEYFYVKDISINLFDELQNLIILSFYIFLEPRRLEYVNLKYKNYDVNNDNYIDMKKNIIVLNNYKTSKIKGSIILNIDNKIFKDLINKFIDLKTNLNIKSDYLLTSLNGNKLQPSQLTIRLNKIFNKKISASMIRKSFLTNLFKDDIDKLKLLDKITKKMGNSPYEALRSYIKK